MLNPHDPHVERDFFEYFTKTTSVLISFVITDSLKKTGKFPFRNDKTSKYSLITKFCLCFYKNIVVSTLSNT